MAGNDGWAPRFDYEEVWVMNTEYALYGEEGPQVTPSKTHRGRLDEMAKCLGAASGNATVRFFWSDAVISVEGPDMGRWMIYTAKKAPTEQQFVKFMWDNIEAAWRGETWTRRVYEAVPDWSFEADDWLRDNIVVSGAKQPTPGIFVWRAPVEVSAPVFLRRSGSLGTVGVLLDYGGADLRFLAKRPVAPSCVDAAGDVKDPEACVTVLGGPKGISDPYKGAVRKIFEGAGVPLLDVCLGPEEEMAHVCIGYLRVHDDAGRFRASVVDLWRLGGQAYAHAGLAVEASLCEAFASAARHAVDLEEGDAQRVVKRLRYADPPATMEEDAVPN